MAPTKGKILVLPGDHVGPEVVSEALKVLDVLEECRGFKFEREFGLCGGCSIDKHGVPITQEMLDLAKTCDAVLFGSGGGPEWADAHPAAETGLLTLRAHLDTFANIRPCEFFAPSLIAMSPLKEHIVGGTKFIVVRENCGGAYYGEKVEKEEYASDVWGYSKPEVVRLARVCAQLARILGRDGKGGGGPATVFSADKANVLASGRLWRKFTGETFKNEAPDIELRDQLADSMALIMVQAPKRFNGIIHTDNTFGDLLSDLAGGIVGTLGTLPSASISDTPGKGKKCMGIYEPVHGSAPDIAGKGVANPAAQILSVAMMLRYSFDQEEDARAIEEAVSNVLDSKENGGEEIRTPDLGGKNSTSEVGQAICSALRKLLS